MLNGFQTVKTIIKNKKTTINCLGLIWPNFVQGHVHKTEKESSRQQENIHLLLVIVKMAGHFHTANKRKRKDEYKAAVENNDIVYRPNGLSFYLRCNSLKASLVQRVAKEQEKLSRPRSVLDCSWFVFFPRMNL